LKKTIRYKQSTVPSIPFFKEALYQMTESFNNPRITDLLPHRGRMLLIQEIVRVDRDAAVSRTEVNERWPLTGDTGASPLLIVELVAQTSGLSNGLDRLITEGQGTETKGWLVGIKRAEFYVDSLPLGAVVETHAQNSFKFEGFREIEGSAMIDDAVVGRVTLQVVRAN
jgi:predicted hotdog family 3-hydroxylacyl-ACP dehydratase